MIRLQKAVYLIYAFFLGIFIIGMLFWKAELHILLNVETPIKEVPVFVRQNIFYLILTAIIFLFVYIVLFRICQRLDRFKPAVIIPIVLGCSVVFQVLIMVLLPMNQFGDADFIYSYFAPELVKGNYSVLQPGQYLYYYPHNMGMALYDVLLLKFLPHSLFIPKVINILLTTLSSLVIYLIYKEIGNNTGKQYGILILASFFLPPLFLNNLVYNDIISCSFFLLGTYCALLYVKNKRFTLGLVSALFYGIGSYMRPLGVIFVIAAILYMIIKAFGIKRIIPYALICIIMLKLPLGLTSFYLEQKGYIQEPLGTNAAPVLKWIHMGISEDRFGYWDENKSLDMYLYEANGNKKASEKLFIEGIKNKIQKMGPVGLMKMYLKKVSWIWTEGTYESSSAVIYDGELAKVIKDTQGRDVFQYETFASKYLSGNKPAINLLNWLMYVPQFLIFCMILFYLVIAIKRKEYNSLLFVFIILGFTGFNILWEIKPRYVFPCYPYMLILAYQGMKELSFIISKKLNKSIRSESDNQVTNL